MLFKGIIDLRKAIEDQRKISEIINELKKINSRKGCPLKNKEDIENLIKNGREILETGKDIIKAYRKSRIQRNLINFSDDDGNNDDDKNTNMPDWMNVSREKFNEIKKEVKNNENIYTKALKNDVISLKNTDKLIDRLNNLDSNNKILDKKTFDIYNEVKKDSIKLAETINKTGETKNRVIRSNIFKLIREIFDKK